MVGRAERGLFTFDQTTAIRKSNGWEYFYNKLLWELEVVEPVRSEDASVVLKSTEEKKAKKDKKEKKAKNDNKDKKNKKDKKDKKEKEAKAEESARD